ncbi:MAG: hypothetical protein ACYS7Y_36020 [Planctomycetota bacterium]|jgi:hypothetical protein
MSKMPVFSNELLNAMLADCDSWEEAVVRAAFTSRGANGANRLRSNKPYSRVSSKLEGCANYVWRMLCFDLAGFGKHVCMPVCADFDLIDAIEVSPGCAGSDREQQRAARRELQEDMDRLVKRVEAALPVEALKGVMRWGRALGMV